MSNTTTAGIPTDPAEIKAAIEQMRRVMADHAIPRGTVYAFNPLDLDLLTPKFVFPEPESPKFSPRVWFDHGSLTRPPRHMHFRTTDFGTYEPPRRRAAPDALLMVLIAAGTLAAAVYPVLVGDLT